MKGKLSTVIFILFGHSELYITYRSELGSRQPNYVLVANNIMKGLRSGQKIHFEHPEICEACFHSTSHSNCIPFS
uniref:Uncharacterized protein n=1 Tax=Pararge aegeria TaxID=116150 RepID=S4PF12_9NEOP